MKTSSLLLSFILVLAAAGCSSEPEAPAAEATTGAETAPAPVEPAPAPVEPAPAPVEPAPAAAQPATPPPPPALPKTSVLIKHKVKDFDAWKPGFDAHQTGRVEMGIKAHAVMRDSKDPKTVYVWAPADDTAKIETAFTGDDMKKLMKDAGVIGKATITHFKEVDMSPPGAGVQPTVGALVDHKVKEFAAFKTAFDSGAQLRTDAGVVGYAVMQDPKDETHVYVWLDATDKAKLETFLASKDLKAKMKEAGVKGAPKITVADMVEFKIYQ